jgi:hypothetical protein
MLEESEKEKEEKIIINKNDIEQMEVDEENYSIKEKIIYILKGISSIISSIMHTFGYYSIWMLGYTNIYLISFRRHYNKSINFSYSYCFIPLLHLSFGLSAPVGGIIEDKLGGKLTIILSDFILFISFIALYISRNIYIDFILIIIIGFGIAIGYNITKKNACSFFMNKKALICGIINLITNILCLVILFYNELEILNYAARPPSLEETYYRKKVFMNYQTLIIFQIKIIIFTCIGSLLLYFQNEPKETIKFGFNEKINNDNNTNDSNTIEKIEKRKKKISKYKEIKMVIKNKRTIRLIIIIFLFFPTINYINNVMRMHITLFFMLGIVYNFIGSISFLIFTLIGDLIQFRFLFAILSALLSVISFMFTQYMGEDDLILLIGIVISSFVFSGFNVIFDAHIMKVYGMKNYIGIWGIIRASGGISEIFGIIFNFTLESNSYVYKIIYFIIGCFNFFSLILGLFETDNKFNYEN